MKSSAYDGKTFSGKVEDFQNPTQLPDSTEQHDKWQDANKSWWENAPMRYDWREEIAAEPGEAAYFEEIDRRFFSAVRSYMPWRERPFDNLIDFASLKDKEVLEIGVGHGSHAQLIAPAAKNYVGIDLTERAAAMTAKRLEQAGVPAEIRQMDAENMDFPDNSFDYIWTWGVIHHSANTLAILKEMQRVLRPGGQAVVMVYRRSWWKYYVMDGLFKGVLAGELFRKGGSLVGVNQAQTDGAIARYYTSAEWRTLCSDVLPVSRIQVFGQKLDIIPLPGGKAKNLVATWTPDVLARLLTNQLRFGSFLVSTHRKAT